MSARDLELALGRIEVGLEAVKGQADASQRTAEQLVGMMEERVMAAVDTLRAEIGHLKVQAEETAKDVRSLNIWRLTVTNRAVGIAVGATLGTTGLTAALVKLLVG